MGVGCSLEREHLGEDRREVGWRKLAGGRKEYFIQHFGKLLRRLLIGMRFAPLILHVNQAPCYLVLVTTGVSINHPPAHF